MTHHQSLGPCPLTRLLAGQNEIQARCELQNGKVIFWLFPSLLVLRVDACVWGRGREEVGKKKREKWMVWVCGGGGETDSEVNTCSVVGRSSLEGSHLCYGGDLAKQCWPHICCHWIKKKSLYMWCWWLLRCPLLAVLRTEDLHPVGLPSLSHSLIEK